MQAVVVAFAYHRRRVCGYESVHGPTPYAAMQVALPLPDEDTREMHVRWKVLIHSTSR